MKNKIILSMFACLMVFAFISSSTYATQLPVDLGTAGNFVILSKAGISTTGTTSIVGDIGVSPIDHTAITGFGLMGDETTDTFLTSALVTGKIYSANLVPPTPINMGTSISNMETAFTDAQGRTTDSSPEDTTELGAGDISGMTIVPGLHKWSSGVLINMGSPTGDPNGVTLDCSSDPNGVFIFQIAQDLTIGNGAQVTLIGNCKTENIFWAVDGGTGVAIGTTAHVEGNILVSKAITLNTGATVTGRLLSQTAVTLDANTVSLPVSAPVPVLTTITLSPNASAVNIGSTLQLSVVSLDQFGDPISATINYTTSDLSIATVDANGLVTAVASGEVTITSSSGAVNGFVNMTVNSASSSGGSGSSGAGGGSGGGNRGFTGYQTQNQTQNPIELINLDVSETEAENTPTNIPVSNPTAEAGNEVTGAATNEITGSVIGNLLKTVPGKVGAVVLVAGVLGLLSYTFLFRKN